MSENKNTATNVSAGKPKIGGAIFMAPLGTTLPTSASNELDVAFKCMGYLGEDGVTNANSPSSEVVRAWGGDPVLTTQTEKDDTFTFKMIEILNVEVLKAVYGANHVEGTLATGITVNANTEQMADNVWVFDMALRNGAMKRIVLPQACISEMDDIEYTDSDAVGYSVTLTCSADAEGNTHKEYIVRSEQS